MDLILPAALLADSTAAVASNPDVVDAAAKKRRSSSKRAATATARVSVKVARRHQCGMCPKSFASPSQLEEHFTYRHSDARTHVCSLCSKVFKTKSNLNQHLRTHVGNRFRCAACPGARPFTESGYRYHLLTKHSDDAVRRRFVCDLCPPGAIPAAEAGGGDLERYLGRLGGGDPSRRPSLFRPCGGGGDRERREDPYLLRLWCCSLSLLPRSLAAAMDASLPSELSSALVGVVLSAAVAEEADLSWRQLHKNRSSRKIYL